MYIDHPNAQLKPILWSANYRGDSLLHEDLAQGVVDRLDGADSGLALESELYHTVNRPDLPSRLRLGDGRESLVGGRGEVLKQNVVLDISGQQLGEAFAVLEKGNFDGPRRNFDYHVRWAAGAEHGGVEGPEARLHHCSHLRDTRQVLGSFSGSENRLQNRIIDSRTEASVVVLSLTPGGRGSS